VVIRVMSRASRLLTIVLIVMIVGSGQYAGRSLSLPAAQAAVGEQSTRSNPVGPLLPQGGRINAPLQMRTVLLAGRVQAAAPAVGDLYHDGYLDIVVGTSDGWVFAIRPDSYNGTILWSFNTKDAMNAIARNPSNTTIHAAPAIADIDGDGWNEVIVPIGTVPQEMQNGGMVVLTHDGKLMPGWPQLTFDKANFTYTNGISTSPAVTDLDGDGKLEIIASSFDNRIYAWHYDGTWVAGWPKHVFDTVWSSPVVGDIDRDGFPEVVVGVDSHLDPYFGSIDGGALYVFRHDGTIYSGFPKYINENFISTPALADLDGNGYLDIIVGGGNFYGGTDGYKVHAWDRFSNYLPGWPVSTGFHVTGSPAIADIDHDGNLEVIVGSWDAKLYAWRRDGTLVSGWPMTPKDFSGNTDPSGNFGSAVVADLNGATYADGKLETFANVQWEVAIVDASGNQLTWDGTAGNPQNKLTYAVDYTLSATPAVADVDRDGKLELIAAAGNTSGAGIVYVWKLPDSSTASSTVGWPLFKHDSARTGNLSRPLTNDAGVVRHTIPDHVLPGQAATVQVVMRNTGTSTWTAAAGYKLAGGNAAFGTPAQVNLSPGDSITPGKQVTLTFNMVAPATQDFYTMDWRMIQEGVESFGAKISVRIKVGNQPAFYVLHKASSNGGVYAGGLAEPISPPSGGTPWQSAPAFKLTKDHAGYYVAIQSGYVRWAGTAADVGSIGGATLVDLVMGPDGEAYLDINSNGVIWKSSGAMNINPLPQTFSDGRVRSFAVTRDYKGVYVLDKYGNIYRGGTAQPLNPGTPTSSDDLFLKIKLTADGRGYYVLDRYGHVYNGGNAPYIAPNYSLHDSEDWARDFELTADGKGYYLLASDGSIYTGGTAEPVTLNPTPTWSTGEAVDLEIADSRVLRTPWLAPSTTSVSMMMASSGPRVSTRVGIDNLGAGGTLTWTAQITPTATWLNVSPTAGTTPATLVFSVTSLLPVGVYAANVHLSATDSAGQPVNAADVAVQLYVVSQLHQVYLPVVLR